MTEVTRLNGALPSPICWKPKKEGGMREGRREVTRLNGAPSPPISRKWKKGGREEGGDKT